MYLSSMVFADVVVGIFGTITSILATKICTEQRNLQTLWSNSSLRLYVRLGVFGDLLDHRQTISNKVSTLLRFFNVEFACYEVDCIMLDCPRSYDGLADDCLRQSWQNNGTENKKYVVKIYLPV